MNWLDYRPIHGVLCFGEYIFIMEYPTKKGREQHAFAVILLLGCRGICPKVLFQGIYHGWRRGAVFRKGEGDTHFLIFFQAQVMEGKQFDALYAGIGGSDFAEGKDVFLCIVNALDDYLPYPGGDVMLLEFLKKTHTIFQMAARIAEIISIVGKFDVQ